MNGRWITGYLFLLCVSSAGCEMSDEDRCPEDGWFYVKELRVCCPNDHIFDATARACKCPPQWHYGADGTTCEPPSTDTGDVILDAGSIDSGTDGGLDTDSEKDSDSEVCTHGLGVSCTDSITHTDCAMYCETFCAWNPVPPGAGRCTKEGCLSSADCPAAYACCDCTASPYLQHAVVCMPPDWSGLAESIGGCTCN